MTLVEETLRAQRSVWKEAAERTHQVSNRELPPQGPHRILLFGIGSSHFVARLIGYALLRENHRIRVPVISCSSMDVGVSVLPKKGDWAFGFSHRGKTPATLNALEICERAGAFTVLVGGKGTRESEGARFFLETCELEKTEPHTISVTSAICATTVLLLGDRAVQEWEALSYLPDFNLDELRNQVQNGATVLVGEWEGEWIAKEGALKLMEMAKIPARSYGTEEFFHGPRRSLSPRDVVWHIEVPGDQRTKELEVTRRLVVHGKTILAWMPTLVELQWLSLATALNLGQNPDG